MFSTQLLSLKIRKKLCNHVEYLKQLAVRSKKLRMEHKSTFSEKTPYLVHMDKKKDIRFTDGPSKNIFLSYG